MSSERPARSHPGSTVWLDGRLVAADAARISPFDHGFAVGTGVFETLKVVRGVPFAMRRHLERLERSAAALGLACPDHDLLRAAAHDVVRANGGGDVRLRITLTGEAGSPGSDAGERRSTLLLTVAELVPAAPTTDVVVVDWVRNERGALTGLKSTSFAEGMAALAAARDAGAGEAIFANTVGNLCEGAVSNVFVVRDGRLVTPPLSAGPLPGVTRELVIELTDAVEEDLPIAALADAEEVFLTSSIRDVQAVAHVDGRALPSAPGPTTVAVAEAFADLVARDLDP